MIYYCWRRCFQRSVEAPADQILIIPNKNLVFLFTNTCNHICLTEIKFKDNFGISCGICFGKLMINVQPADMNLSGCNQRKHENLILQKIKAVAALL